MIKNYFKKMQSQKIRYIPACGRQACLPKAGVAIFLCKAKHPISKPYSVNNNLSSTSRHKKKPYYLIDIG